MGRKLETGTVQEVEKGIKDLSRDFYAANNAANEAKREAEAKRKALFSAMKSAGIENFEHRCTVAGKTVTLATTITTPTRDVVDIELLSKRISMDEMLGVVSATNKAVEEKFGRNLLNRVVFTREGTEAVSVKVAK